MANTGLPWELPYQLLTDPPNGPLAQQELAERIAGLLGYAYPCTSTTRPTNRPGLIIHESDTGLLYVGDGVDWDQLHAGGDDTGWLDCVTAGWTPVGAFTISSGQCRRKWGLVSIYITLVSTNAIAAGDIVNTSILQAPAGWIPGMGNGGFNGGANAGYTVAYITSAGVVSLTASGGVGAGSSFNVTGTYML